MKAILTASLIPLIFSCEAQVAKDAKDRECFHTATNERIEVRIANIESVTTGPAGTVLKFTDQNGMDRVITSETEPHWKCRDLDGN